MHAATVLVLRHIGIDALLVRHRELVGVALTVIGQHEEAVDGLVLGVVTVGIVWILR